MLAGDLDQTHRVGRVGGTHDQEQVGARGDRGHGPLAVGGGVADVLVARAVDAGKAPLQHHDDGGGVGERERGLGRVGEPRGLGRGHRLGVGHALDQQDRAGCHLPHGADHLGMAGMADQQDGAPGLVVALDLAVHLGDQRAGGIGEQQAATARLGRDRLGHAMGGEDDQPILGHLVQLLDEHGTQPAQLVHHMAVVDDLVADIDRCPVLAQGGLDHVDGALDAGAEAARPGEQDGERNGRRQRQKAGFRLKPQAAYHIGRADATALLRPDGVDQGVGTGSLRRASRCHPRLGWGCVGFELVPGGGLGRWSGEPSGGKTSVPDISARSAKS